MFKKTSLLIVLFATTSVASAAAPAPVSVRETEREFLLANGLVEVAVSRETGQVTNLRDLSSGSPHELGDSLYWDANAEVLSPPAGATPPKKGYFRGAPTEVVLSHKSAERAEVVVRTGNSTFFQFDVDYHFALFPGQSGLYAYVVVDHTAEQAAARLWQTRFVFRTVTDGTFKAWSTGSDNLVPIPTAASVKTLMDATFLLADGTVKTKYQNSVYWADAPVYGVLGAYTDTSAVGVWMIEPSPEYHNGGPVKQGQTVHDNVLLRVLQSVHFGASPVDVAQGEPWRKVYGPFLLYVNHAKDVASLWADAKRQHAEETARWPYAWVDSPGYAKQRTTVTGRIRLTDGDVSGARVVLSDPGVAWTAQSKGYNFWTRADRDGSFTIRNVIPGTYALHVSGGDQPADFVRENIVVDADKPLDVGTLDWSPARNGKTLWQIGTFDRSAGEFRNGDDARQYQMFTLYPKQFPSDVSYTVGQSDPKKDWNYAQWSWYAKNPAWRVSFDAPTTQTGTATLTLAFASAQPANGPTTDLRVAINGKELSAIQLPKTGTAGYRGGVQDSPYHVKQIAFDATLLRAGTNELTLRHADGQPFPATVVDQGDNDEVPPGTGGPGQVMYDAIRLEVKP